MNKVNVLPNLILRILKSVFHILPEQPTVSFYVFYRAAEVRQRLNYLTTPLDLKIPQKYCMRKNVLGIVTKKVPLCWVENIKPSSCENLFERQKHIKL